MRIEPASQRKIVIRPQMNTDNTDSEMSREPVFSGADPFGRRSSAANIWFDSSWE